MSVEKMKPVLLAPEFRTSRVSELKPVVLVWAKCRWDMWVLDGTVLRGWNSVFLLKEDAELLIAEEALYPTDDDGEIADEPYKTLSDLEVVLSEDKTEFYSGLICFEDLDFQYINSDDDPWNEK